MPWPIRPERRRASGTVRASRPPNGPRDARRPESPAKRACRWNESVQDSTRARASGLRVADRGGVVRDGRPGTVAAVGRPPHPVLRRAVSVGTWNLPVREGQRTRRGGTGTSFRGRPPATRRFRCRTTGPPIPSRTAPAVPDSARRMPRSERCTSPFQLQLQSSIDGMAGGALGCFTRSGSERREPGRSWIPAGTFTHQRTAAVSLIDDTAAE